MSKTYQNFDRFQDGATAFLERPGGLRGALGGKTRGVKNAKDLRKLMFGDFFLHFLPRLRPKRQGNENKTKNIRQLGLGHHRSPIQHAVLPSPSVRAADLIAQRAVRKAGPKSSLNKLNMEKPKVNIEN